MALTALARIGICEDEIPCLDCFYYQHVQVRVWLGNQPHPMRKYKANPYQRNNFGRTPYEMRDGLFLRKSIYVDLLQSLAGSCDSTSDCHFGGIQATHCRAIDLVACAQRRVLCKHSKEKRSSIQFVKSSLEVSTSPGTTVLQILQGVWRCFKATIV